MADFAAFLSAGSVNDKKHLSWRGYLILLLLCLAFFVPGIQSLPPTDRDESLFAQATKQMIETGDYVNINFLGTPRYKKPVGIYWLQSLSVRVLNPDHLNEMWAYRVPSLIGATLAVLLTAALGTLLFHPLAGFMAGVMLASCLDLGIEAHLAKTDAALLAAVMLTQYALARAYVLSTTGWLNAGLFWSAIGLGILLKGPIVLLPLFSVLLWLRLTEKDLSWFKRLKPFVGIPYMLLLVAPWFIAINLASHGQFTEASAGHDFLAKIWQGQDRGFLPPGLHTLAFPIMFFPFSLFSFLAIPDAWAARKNKPVCFLLGWIIPTWIVFELSLTKLPHYVLPAYPAIAILTANFFLEGFPALLVTGRRWITGLAASWWILIGLVFAAGMAALPYVVDGATNDWQIVTSCILLFTQSLGLLFFAQRRRNLSIMTLAFGTCIFSSFAFAHTIPSLQHLWISRAIVDEARRISPCEKLSLVSTGYAEPSLAFLAGTNTKLEPNGTFAAAEMQHDLCRVGVIKDHMLKNFLEASTDFPTQPYPAGSTVEGINNGHGSSTKMYFYLMPQTREPTPVYP